MGELEEKHFLQEKGILCVCIGFIASQVNILSSNSIELSILVPEV
jgi:hypothetical protein